MSAKTVSPSRILDALLESINKKEIIQEFYTSDKRYNRRYRSIVDLPSVDIAYDMASIINDNWEMGGLLCKIFEKYGAKFQLTDDQNSKMSINDNNNVNNDNNSNAKRQFGCDIGVLIAKDKEFSWFEGVFQEFGYVVVQGHPDSSFMHWSTEISGKTIKYSYLNTMGFEEMKKNVKSFIHAVNPKYITTIGICGSLRENLTKAIFITEAAYGDPNNKEAKYKTVGGEKFIPNQLIPDFHRDEDPIMLDHSNPNARKIFTSTLIDPKEETEEEVIQFLGKGYVGVEMEIAAFFLEIKEINEYNPEKSVICLPAIKGVSDYGSREVRKANGKEAARNAVKMFIKYVIWLKDTKRIK